MFGNQNQAAPESNSTATIDAQSRNKDDIVKILDKITYRIN